jgi:hypothetical protein
VLLQLHIMPAPADYSGPTAAPATSMVWQQQYQGQQSMFGMLDLVPGMHAFDKELSVLRQRAHQLTADRLHLQPQLTPLLAPAPAANTAMGRYSLFGAALLVSQAERLPKRQWPSSPGSPPPPTHELLGALPMGAAPWLDPSSVQVQPCAASRPATKKPRNAGPATAAETEERMMADDAAAPWMAAATQLFLQQILADVDADQDPNPRTATPGPQFPQFVLAAPGPLDPTHFELGPAAGPTTDPVVPAPASPAAGPVHPPWLTKPEAGNNHARNRKHPRGDLSYGVQSAHSIVKETANSRHRHNRYVL